MRVICVVCQRSVNTNTAIFAKSQVLNKQVVICDNPQCRHDVVALHFSPPALTTDDTLER